MSTRELVIKSAKFLSAIILFVVVVFGGWWALYPGPDDPKGLMYIGWRLGLPTLDSDQALGAMVGDVHRDDLVIGKMQSDLATRFGFVTRPEESSKYDQYCYRNSDYYGKNVLFLRRSNWMVVMNNGRVVDLVLAKGC